MKYLRNVAIAIMIIFVASFISCEQGTAENKADTSSEGTKEKTDGTSGENAGGQGTRNEDANNEDSGSKATGSESTGSESTGSQTGTGSEIGTGSESTGGESTGSQTGTGSEIGTGSESTGSESTGSESTGSEITSYPWDGTYSMEIVGFRHEIIVTQHNFVSYVKYLSLNGVVNRNISDDITGKVINFKIENDMMKFHVTGSDADVSIDLNRLGQAQRIYTNSVTKVLDTETYTITRETMGDATEGTGSETGSETG